MWALLQWGRDLSVAETGAEEPRGGPCLPCFNGAATFQSQRRRLLPGQRRRTIIRLQWGRDLSVAETRECGRHCQTGLRASMGPRPFRRRDVCIRANNLEDVLELQWGRDLSVAETSRKNTIASACTTLQWGPRPFSRRDLKGVVTRQSWTELQWGRDLSVAETRECRVA